MDCIFCKIDRGEIPSEKVYEDDDVFVIRDIDPKAEKHYLMIPKRHYKLIGEMTDSDGEALMRGLRKIPSLADKLGLSGGYRLVINQGDDAGQSVFHLHIHILGGQPLDFPDLRTKK